ncbi:ABC transporter ATP-binding protein [Corynebacterium sputi]|uniref:ABC transporter ATP-binding protein n=1 Tax=Corynebacterium sputi TaxID=489915 RepID=UPI0006864AA9|nr:ABC transporter ATP-binding protein [Corynebacterium sputi]
MSTALTTASSRETWKALVVLIRRHWTGFAIAVGLVILGSLASIAGPLILGRIVDAVTDNGPVAWLLGAMVSWLWRKVSSAGCPSLRWRPLVPACSRT